MYQDIGYRATPTRSCARQLPPLAGERIEGGFAIAAPFFGHDGTCQGSIVFTSPLSRLERDRIPEYGTAVKAAADAVSARLGYRIKGRSRE